MTGKNATRTERAETTSDGEHIGQAGPGGTDRKEVEPGDKGMRRRRTEMVRAKVSVRDSRTRTRNGQSGRERGSSPVRMRTRGTEERRGIPRSTTKPDASRSKGRGPVRNKHAEQTTMTTNEREDTGRMTRSKVRKKDGDGAVT